MQSKERRERVRQLILQQPVITQEELVSRLVSEGFSATQSTLSRDLSELGATKRQGKYVLPTLGQTPWQQAGLLSAHPAGPHLLVMKCEVGTAQRVGFLLDQSDIPGVIGTLAGDDTIFLAVAGAEAQSHIMQALEGNA